MSYSVENIAEVCHEAHRALQRIQGEIVNFPWESTSQDLRDSIIDGVRNVIAGESPEESHDNWLRFKRSDGWVYGPVKDFAKKEHPCFVPYDHLPADQQSKDALFAQIVGALS